MLLISKNSVLLSNISYETLADNNQKGRYSNSSPLWKSVYPPSLSWWDALQSTLSLLLIFWVAIKEKFDFKWSRTYADWNPCEDVSDLFIA